jgi:hypothetical protein|tara:strand:+ start:105 stop:485 length:381 start_codon:yes stop_codon:yes gene_type:complete
MGKNKNKNKNKPAEVTPETGAEEATPEVDDATMEEKDAKVEEKVEEKSEGADSKEAETTASNEEKEDTKKSDEPSDTSSNDGVKILEEVFGKASVEEKPKEETPTTPDAAASFGPEPPKDNEYPED